MSRPAYVAPILTIHIRPQKEQQQRLLHPLPHPIETASVIYNNIVIMAVGLYMQNRLKYIAL